MNVNFKKMRKPLILTLLVFSVGAFCVYQTARSKYFSNHDEHLVYDVEYEKLDKKDVILDVDPETTVYPNVLGFVASFYRSNYVLETDESVKYTFEVDSGCIVSSTSVSPEHAQLKINESKSNIATLTYNKEFILSDLEDPITVKYTCSASALNVSGKTNFKVKEQFRPEGAEKFESTAYVLGSATKPFKKNVLYVPKTYPGSIYDYIIQTSHFLVGEESDYLKSVYTKDNITDMNPDTKPSLKGFKVSEDDEYYIYEKDRNFTSYAYTYESYLEGSSSLWFLDDTATKDEINDLFEYYMSVYYSKLTDEEKTAIINYIKESKVSLKDVLDGKGKIGGIYHGGARFIELEPNIMLYVDPPKNIEVDYAITGDNSKLVPYLSTYLGDQSVFAKFVTPANLLAIRAQTAIRPILKTNPTVETYTYSGPYIDSTTSDDPNVVSGPQTIMVEIHSVPGSTAGTGIHYVSIYVVEPEKDYSLFFTPIMTTDGGEGATINYTATKDMINGVLENFNSSISVDETMLQNPTEGGAVYIEPDTGLITVSFKSKPEEVVVTSPAEETPSNEPSSEEVPSTPSSTEFEGTDASSQEQETE